MRAVDIALKDLRVLGRDLKALASIIAMPLILIMILGAALGGMFSRGESVNPFKVAVVDLDGGPSADVFKELLRSERISGLMAMVSAADEEEAVALIRDMKVSAAVIIPKGASNFSDLTAKTFRVLGDPGYALRGQVTKSVVESYAQQYSALFAGTSNIVAALREAAVAAPREQEPGHGQPNPVSGPVADPEAFSKMVATIQERLLSETTRAAGLFASSQQKGNWITASQYYTAGMTVMYVMFGAMFGAKTILEEKNQKTLARIFSAKATKRDVIVGKTLATFLISFLQILILVTFTTLVYRTKWGDPLGVLAVTGSLSLAATGFSILMAALAKTEKMSDALQNFGVQAMSFLGGCQFPIYLFPPALHAVSRLTLTRWGLDAYLSLMQGRLLSDVAQSVAVLTGMGLVFLTAGIGRLKLD